MWTFLMKKTIGAKLKMTKSLTTVLTLKKLLESDFIHRNTSEIQMNSKAEWHQPAVARVVVTRELEEGQGGRVEPRGRGRTRAKGGA